MLRCHNRCARQHGCHVDLGIAYLVVLRGSIGGEECYLKRLEFGHGVRKTRSEKCREQTRRDQGHEYIRCDIDVERL